MYKVVELNYILFVFRVFINEAGSFIFCCRDVVRSGGDSRVNVSRTEWPQTFKLYCSFSFYNLLLDEMKLRKFGTSPTTNKTHAINITIAFACCLYVKNNNP